VGEVIKIARKNSLKGELSLNVYHWCYIVIYPIRASRLELVQTKLLIILNLVAFNK